MKLKNVDKCPIVESIRDTFSHAEKNKHVAIDPVTANAIEASDKHEKDKEEAMKEPNKAKDELVKKHEEDVKKSSKQVKVKDRKEMSKLIKEAKELNHKYKISRCDEEGFRFIFEEFIEEETKDTKPLVEENKPAVETKTVETKPAEKKLNEDEQLPPAVAEVKVEEPVVKEDDKKAAEMNIISNATKACWDHIDMFQSFARSLEAENMNSDVVSILRSIVDDTLVHIGMLQNGMGQVDNQKKQLIDSGEEKAETIVSEPATKDLVTDEEVVNAEPVVAESVKTEKKTEKKITESLDSEDEPIVDDAEVQKAMNILVPNNK